MNTAKPAIGVVILCFTLAALLLGWHLYAWTGLAGALALRGIAETAWFIVDKRISRTMRDELKGKMMDTILKTTERTTEVEVQRWLRMHLSQQQSIITVPLNDRGQ